MPMRAVHVARVQIHPAAAHPVLTGHATTVVVNAVDQIPARLWWTPTARRSWEMMVSHVLPLDRIAIAAAHAQPVDVHITRHKKVFRAKNRLLQGRNARVLAAVATGQIQTKARVSQVRNAVVARAVKARYLDKIKANAVIAPQVNHASVILATALAKVSGASA